MTWEDSRTRIRRFLRDPNGVIWSDAMLRRLFNDEQNSLQTVAGFLRDARSIDVPSQFVGSYLHDFEWAYSGQASGEVYQPGYFHDAEQAVCSSRWELQHLSEIGTDDSLEAYQYVHPFEAWLVSTPAEPPPVTMPIRFHKMIFVAHDNDPIEPTTRRELISSDRTWRTRASSAMNYWRDDHQSNRLYLYPLPEAVWTDAVTGEDDMLTAAYAAESSSGLELASGDELETIDGGPLELVESQATEKPLLVVCEKEPEPITDDGQTTEYPSFFTKYLEYGVLANAYRANTDGRIDSLAEYWEMRKKAGFATIRRFMVKRLADRDLRLRSSKAGNIRKHRHPRLPDTYPAVYP